MREHQLRRAQGEVQEHDLRSHDVVQNRNLGGRAEAAIVPVERTRSPQKRRPRGVPVLQSQNVTELVRRGVGHLVDELAGRIHRGVREVRLETDDRIVVGISL